MAESNNVQQSSAEEAVHEEEPRHVMSTEEKTTPAQNSDMRRKEALISEILQLQNTLHDLSQRVHCVREENEQLQVDNQVRSLPQPLL